MQSQREHNNQYYHCNDGLVLYAKMKHALVDKLGTPLETFEDAALHYEHVLLKYYHILPENLLYAAIGAWFSLRLQYKESKIIHLVPATISIPPTSRVRCLLCDRIVI